MSGKSVRNTDCLALTPRIRRASYTGYSSPSRYQTNHESLSLRQELLKKMKRNQRTTDIPPVVFATISRRIHDLRLWQCGPCASHPDCMRGIHWLRCKGWKEGKRKSAITVKGQTTIPKHLGLQPGDRVKFFVASRWQCVVLLPKLSASAIRGMVKSRNPRPVTAEPMTAVVAKAALSRNPRRRHR
jgi:bifunctional DNA-binding transcriptional regulator/antitoxin component of YhaV-PrlF toxin-antitoxin module